MSFPQFAFYWAVCFIVFKAAWSLLWISLAALDRKIQGERKNARHFSSDL